MPKHSRLKDQNIASDQEASGQFSPLCPAELVENRSGRLVTTSLKVAEVFGRQHKHVMARIRALDAPGYFLTANFSAVKFEHRGNQYRACEMTKDGFVFLVMGFTGEQAATFKVAYIEAFNEMERILSQAKGTSALDLVGNTTIGTDGFRCLAAVLDGKVRHLPLPMRRRAKGHIWSQVHKAFSVISAENIPADQMDCARNFLAAYTLEGEWLAPDKSLPLERQSEIHFPISKWLKDNPWIARKHCFVAKGELHVTSDMLCSGDIKSPTKALLMQLQKEGHNVDACWIEMQAMRHHIGAMRGQLRQITMGAENTMGSGVSFKVEE